MLRLGLLLGHFASKLDALAINFHDAIVAGNAATKQL